MFNDSWYYTQAHSDHTLSYWIIAMYFEYYMIRLGIWIFHPISMMYLVCYLISPDLAHHRTLATAESIIPNLTLGSFLMQLSLAYGESFHMLMHMAAVLDWDIQHFDIKTAFLHGVVSSWGNPLGLAPSKESLWYETSEPHLEHSTRPWSSWASVSSIGELTTDACGRL